MTTIGPSVPNASSVFLAKLLQGTSTAPSVNTGTLLPDIHDDLAILLGDPESGDVSDFIYGPSGRFSADNPDKDVVIGLPPTDQSVPSSASNHPSKLTFEIKIGNVVLARVYESGVIELADGFDYSSISFDTEEAGVEGLALANDRADRVLTFFARLTFEVNIFGPDGAAEDRPSESGDKPGDTKADIHEVDSNKRMLLLMLEVDRFQSSKHIQEIVGPGELLDRNYLPEDMTEEELEGLSDDEYLLLLRETLREMIHERHAHAGAASTLEITLALPTS